MGALHQRPGLHRAVKDGGIQQLQLGVGRIRGAGEDLQVFLNLPAVGLQLGQLPGAEAGGVHGAHGITPVDGGVFLGDVQDVRHALLHEHGFIPHDDGVAGLGGLLLGNGDDGRAGRLVVEQLVDAHGPQHRHQNAQPDIEVDHHIALAGRSLVGDALGQLLTGGRLVAGGHMAARAARGERILGEGGKGIHRSRVIQFPLIHGGHGVLWRCRRLPEGLGTSRGKESLVILGRRGRRLEGVCLLGRPLVGIGLCCGGLPGHARVGGGEIVLLISLHAGLLVGVSLRRKAGLPLKEAALLAIPRRLLRGPVGHHSSRVAKRDERRIARIALFVKNS